MNHEAEYRGRAAMERLAAAKVCLCGGGAIGSNLAESFVRLGVRTLRVIDRDRVEPHNVGTQIYAAEDAGAMKVEALKERLFRVAGVEIEAVGKELTAANARKLLEGFDLVVDGFDNSASRRLVTEICRERSWPCLHAGFNGGFGEVRWNERYRVPSDGGEDVCDYPLARNLVQLVTAVAAEAAVRFLTDGSRRDYSITLKDLKINPEDEG